MSKKQRYIELFTENLPEPYRTAAISQIDEDYIERLKETPKNIAEALVFFVPLWNKTKEGRIFWESVHRHFFSGSKFSELPPYPKHLPPPQPTPEPKQVQKNIVEVLIDIKKEGREQCKLLMDILALTRKEIKELQSQNAKLITEIQTIKNLLQ